jgi:hypothetical protein
VGLTGTLCATEAGSGSGREAQETNNKADKIQKALLVCCRKVISVIVPKAKSQSATAIKLIQLFFPC